MNPELLSKQDFAATIDPLHMTGQFAFVSQFLNGSLEEARIMLGSKDAQTLRTLAGLLGWRKGGNAIELAGRLLNEKTVFDFARCRSRETLVQQKRRELDFALNIIGKGNSWGNKQSRATQLLNFVNETVGSVQFGVADKIQTEALTAAIRQRRPVSRSLAIQWNICTSIERVGYALRGDTYEFAGAIEEVFELDGRKVSRETVQRKIEEAEQSIDSVKKAIETWQGRVRDYAPDGTWPDREFAARCYPIAQKCLEDSRQRLTQYEAELFSTRELLLNDGAVPEQIVYQAELTI